MYKLQQLPVDSWLDAPKVVIPHRLAPLSLFQKEAQELAQDHRCLIRHQDFDNES